jgi:hypothetical protein
MKRYLWFSILLIVAASFVLSVSSCTQTHNTDTTTTTTTSTSSTTTTSTTTTTVGDFTISIIDSTVGYGTYNSLAFDSSDYAHVSYKGTLKYSTNSSGAWSSSDVDLTTGSGVSSSIAVATNGDVCISYCDEDGSGQSVLGYGINPGSGWVTTVLDTFEVTYTSIALDASDNVHIAYYRVDTGTLHYATNKTGSWAYDEVDATTGRGTRNSIAVDSNGQVHISYFDASGNRLKYASGEAGSWAIETPDNTAYSSALTTDIALDSNNMPHICYSEAGTLSYATKSSGSWVHTNLDTGWPTFKYGSIAIDDSDQVHMSYGISSGSDYYLRYATYVSGAWEYYQVADNGSYNSIAIRGTNEACVSFYDEVQEILKFAVRN